VQTLGGHSLLIPRLIETSAFEDSPPKGRLRANDIGWIPAGILRSTTKGSSPDRRNDEASFLDWRNGLICNREPFGQLAGSGTDFKRIW